MHLRSLESGRDNRCVRVEVHCQHCGPAELAATDLRAELAHPEHRLWFDCPACGQRQGLLIDNRVAAALVAAGAQCVSAMGHHKSGPTVTG